MSLSHQTKETIAYQDQKPGTSGLRKRVRVFLQENYTHNFIQSILSVLTNTTPRTLIIGGDGRYYSHEAIQIIASISSANGVQKLIIGKSGIISTPAASHLIRINKATGAILLTASHNPGGIENDFGIKLNMENGGPAPESITNKIFEISKAIKSYNYTENIIVDLETIGIQQFGEMQVEIIDPVVDYMILMQTIFDFDLIKHFFKETNVKVLFDGMHGVTGPYLLALVQKLELPMDSLMNCVPSLDFNGGHPDPNLTYAHELCRRVDFEKLEFGAAFDGDGDRNMVYGNCFVNPSDSIAVIAANSGCIPFFKNGLKGVARSMPTSGALDRVANKRGISFFEVPTGWKFFGNLMDAEKLSICGEESFGQGSCHIREKDGIWAVLAWLSIIAFKKSNIQQILKDHWHEFGRNYFTRFDYEEVDSLAAATLMQMMRDTCGEMQGRKYGSMEIKLADDYRYVDEIHHSVSENQGLRILFTDGSRIIFRLSGTGSQGATVRLYIEKYEPLLCDLEPLDALKELIEIALELSQLEKHIERKSPTVIT